MKIFYYTKGTPGVFNSIQELLKVAPDAHVLAYMMRTIQDGKDTKSYTVPFEVSKRAVRKAKGKM